MSQRDLEVLLTYLSRDKGLVDYDGQTIKFKPHSDGKPPKITQEDSSIASLKNLMFDIEKQVEMLAARINTLSVTARDSVSRKNRVTAVAALRSKKLAESQLAKQSAVLGQLEEVYSKIGEAADQVELMRIMEGSTGVLKSLHREIGGVERVDDVLSRLGEQMTQVDEIGNALTEINRGGVVDEIDVEDELEALELEDQDKKEPKVVSNESKEDSAANTNEQLGSLEREARACINQTNKTPAEKQITEGLVDGGSRALQQLSL
jgi:charged multivesicular body protein 7